MVFFGLMCFAMYADEGELITVILFAAFCNFGTGTCFIWIADSFASGKSDLL